MLEVELQDQTAEAEWTLNGKPIETSDRSVELYLKIMLKILCF